MGRQRRWCSGERVCLGSSQPGQAAQEAALTSAPGAVAPRPVAAPRARKNSRQPGGSTQKIGPRVKEERRAKEQKKKAVAHKWDGTGAKPCTTMVPKTLFGVSSHSSRFLLKAGHRKPVWARSGDVYYPTICSLPKITVIDMRSTKHVSVIDTYWI